MVKRTVAGLTIVAVVLLAVPFAAHAQPAQKVPRIGVLFVNAREPLIPFIEALEDGFRELGYLQGRNLSIDYRFAEGRPERLPGLAGELSSLNVAVFVVPFTTTAEVVLQVSTNTPIVVPFAMDPVGVGLAKSLARPGGNVTGLTVNAGPEIFGKNLELLKEVLPKGARVGILFNPTSQIYVGAHVAVIEDAGRKLGLTTVRAEVRSVSEFEHGIVAMKQKHVTGIVVLDEPLFYANRRRLNDLALRSGLATSWPGRQGPETGALMSYGVELRDLYRRAAGFVDKILKGTKAGDIPVEQPTTFELVINTKTAKALGLTIPPSLLLRADQLVER